MLKVKISIIYLESRFLICSKIKSCKCYFRERNHSALKGFGTGVRFSSTRRISLPVVEANELCKKSNFFIKLSLKFLRKKGLTSSRRLRICKTISVLYSLLYGRALFSPVHCFEFMCLLFCKFCLLPELRAEKNTSCGTCLKATFRKVVKCAYFLEIYRF